MRVGLFGALAYRAKEEEQEFNKRGLVIVLLSGLLNGFFFRMITATLASDFAKPAIPRPTAAPVPMPRRPR